MQREEEVNNYELEHNTDVLVGTGNGILFHALSLPFPVESTVQRPRWLVACFDTHETKVRINCV
jgi:hypothetical protein